MVLLELGGLVACFGLNVVFSQIGHYWKQDKDFFIPPAAILFTFYPLIIALPEAHYKLINYSLEDNPNQKVDEDQLFPYAFLISLLSITAAMIVDKFCLRKTGYQDEDGHQQGHQQAVQKGEEKGEEAHLHAQTWTSVKVPLQFLLSLSIALQNVVNYYFICVQPNQGQLLKEIVLFLMFSLLINFSHAYLLAQTGVNAQVNLRLSLFMNAGMAVGLLLSAVVKPDMVLLVLPCICSGLQIYCSIFLTFPFIFSNGERLKQDKSRFLAIIIAFLATVIYYPICYMLRI